MKHSSYVWNPAFESDVAVGHNVGGAPVDLWKADQANAAASLDTTAEDYAIFLDAVLTGKRAAAGNAAGDGDFADCGRSGLFKLR